MSLTDTGYYGDDVRWFVGTVINVYDPDMLGRIQVRIHGVHDPSGTNIDNSKLPWAKVMLPSTEGGTSGIGRIPQILPSALVFGFFLDGQSSQAPLILGTLNKIERPSQAQENFYSVEGDASVIASRNQYPDGIVNNDTLTTLYNNGEATAGQRRLIAMMFLVQNGLKPHIAAGIVGNLEGENSQFDPGKPSDVPGERSKGLAQWNPAPGAMRLQKLEQYAINNRLYAYDFFTQLAFIIHELRGTERNGDGGGAFSTLYERLLKSTTFEGGVSKYNSTWLFLDKYENPANKRSKLAQREKFARIAIEQFYAAHQVT